MQVGQKRTKSMNEPTVVPAKASQAPSSDGGAKQALENEFECTICRVSFVQALVFHDGGSRLCFLCQLIVLWILQDFMVATHSVVPCGHMFCGECLSEWLQKNPSCPKCRAAATAPPVRTMAVDNVLESLIEKGMSKDDLQERKQRKQHWEAHAVNINSKMKHLFRHGGQRPPHGYSAPFHGHQAPNGAINWEVYAAMQQGKMACIMHSNLFQLVFLPLDMQHSV